MVILTCHFFSAPSLSAARAALYSCPCPHSAPGRFHNVAHQILQMVFSCVHGEHIYRVYRPMPVLAEPISGLPNPMGRSLVKRRNHSTNTCGNQEKATHKVTFLMETITVTQSHDVCKNAKAIIINCPKHGIMFPQGCGFDIHEEIWELQSSGEGGDYEQFGVWWVCGDPDCRIFVIVDTYGHVVESGHLEINEDD